MEGISNEMAFFIYIWKWVLSVVKKPIWVDKSLLHRPHKTKSSSQQRLGQGKDAISATDTTIIIIIESAEAIHPHCMAVFVPGAK